MSSNKSTTQAFLCRYSPRSFPRGLCFTSAVSMCSWLWLDNWLEITTPAVLFLSLCLYFIIYDVIKRADWTEQRDTWNQIRLLPLLTFQFGPYLKDAVFMCCSQPPGGRSRWFGKLSHYLLSSQETQHEPNGSDLFLSVRRATEQFNQPH